MEKFALSAESAVFLVLTGPKHSGKTTVGAALAQRLDAPFYDLDVLVEQKTGKSPRALYLEGPELFRAAEAEALKAFFAEKAAAISSVLASGGGIADNQEALVLLRDARRRGLAYLVYLDLDAETAWKRIAQGPLPPFLLTGGETPPREVHRQLHERRARLYGAMADTTIRCGGKSPGVIAEEIIRLVKKRPGWYP